VPQLPQPARQRGRHARRSPRLPPLTRAGPPGPTPATRDVAAAASANARNKIYFTVDPKDARELAHHTLPELDEHDLGHLDRHTAAARLVINAQETPAFTLATKPPSPVVGEATAVRAACNTTNEGQREPSAIETLARNMARRRNQQHRRHDSSAHTGPVSGA
jgi:hypothetical protein